LWCIIPSRVREEVGSVGICVGYVKAVLDLGTRLGDANRFCPAAEVTTGQAVHVLMKYLNDHPEATHQTAANLALAAFRSHGPAIR
jgi:Rap1a immunity proteins